jgi:hypothetical protein
MIHQIYVLIGSFYQQTLLAGIYKIFGLAKTIAGAGFYFGEYNDLAL